jgi:hypothetical protein
MPAESVTVDETCNKISFFSDTGDFLLPGYNIPKPFQTLFIARKILFPKENHSAGKNISAGFAENQRETDFKWSYKTGYFNKAG